jgi:hypothetical protein
MSATWFGPLLVAALLAVGAGVVKVLRPHNTVVAIEAVLATTRFPARAGGGPPVRAGKRFRVAPALVRIGSAGEMVVGIAALAGSRWGCAALAASYVAFAIFVAVALHRGAPVSSCGCFGEPDVPPTWTHVLFDLAAAAVAATAAARDVPSLPSVLGAQPLGGVPFVAIACIATAAAYLLLSELPKVRA